MNKHVVVTRHPRRSRRGSTITEFIVAFGLLSTLLACAVPAVTRNGRLQQGLRHDRIGMDELSNQLDRLTNLPVEQLRMEVQNLQPSSFAVANLPSPDLVATLEASEDGQRLSLQLAWDSPGRAVNPLVMTTWFYTRGAPAEETR